MAGSSSPSGTKSPDLVTLMRVVIVTLPTH